MNCRNHATEICTRNCNENVCSINKFYFIKNCENCNKPLKQLRSTKKGTRFFCDNKCQQDIYYKEFIERWLEGNETGIIKGGWQVQMSGFIRRYMLEEAGYKCSICEWDKLHSDGKSPLQIDHKDGNATNNSKENLSVLCPNCHSLTETFGSRNKKSTRYISSTR